jgi:hypothetical protein
VASNNLIRVRRVVLGVLIVAAVVLFALSGLPEVCTERLPTASSTPVNVCEPMAATDPRALLFILVLGLLLLPELAELEIGGVLKVRRQLEDVKDEATELKGELAHIRTQVLTAANANASVVNNLYGPRPEDVAAGASEVDGQGDGKFDEQERSGAVALLAFQSGLSGLTDLLPSWVSRAAIVGYTFGENGDLEPFYVVHHGQNAEAFSPPKGTVWMPNGDSDVYIESGGHVLVVTVRPFSAARQYVGALAVHVPDEVVQEAGSARDFDNLVDDVVEVTDLMADVYARMLLDLLGEEPRPWPTGKTTTDGGQ